MPVFGKQEFCYTNRSLICDEQGVGKFPLWQRYEALQVIVNKYLPKQYTAFFAQPQHEFTANEERLVWYIPNSSGEQPVALSELSGERKEKYLKIKNDTIQAYRDAIANSLNANNDDAEYLQKAMKYAGDFDEFVFCYDNRVVVLLWGMRPRKLSDPKNIVINKQLMFNKSFKVIFDLAGKGTSKDNLVLYKREDDAPIFESQVPNVSASKGYIFIGWNVNPLGYRVTANTQFVAQYDHVLCDVKFNVGENGKTSDETVIHNVIYGSSLNESQIPRIEPNEGYKFVGWNTDPMANGIFEDMSFDAIYEPLPIGVVPPVVNPEPSVVTSDNLHNVTFLDENGNVISLLKVKDGETIEKSAIPQLSAKSDAVFKGWGDGVNQPIYNDCTFTPLFDKKRSCWQKLKSWWTGKKCLKWFIRFLLLLLLLLCLIWFLRDCKRGTSDWNTPFPDNPVNPLPINPVDPDDPGFRELPEEPTKPLPIDDDDDIIDNPDDKRPIVGNRLNVLLDDENLTITGFAADFKNAYPDDKYSIIYADPITKRLQIKVPSDERETVKRELVNKLPDKYHGGKVFIWDESLFEEQLTPNDLLLNKCWYHNTIKSYNAWNITQGSDSLIIAVLDDGFQLLHEEFIGKIVKPYNVYTKGKVVSETSKHGTHVAGLALAKAGNGKGISGVAPRCRLMPVKVFDDNGKCSFTAVVDGVLYAIYSGAKVVNLSLGMSINSNLSRSRQIDLINNHFKEEERVWKKVFSIANKYHVTIVIAAGNENVMAGIEPMHRSDDVIVVAATDGGNNELLKTGFSNYGRYTDVSAPGQYILSSVGMSQYEFMSGTSMSAPIVTGAVALMKSLDANLTTAQIRSILQETGLQVQGDIGNLIQLDKALQKVKKGDAKPIPSTGSVQLLLEWHNINDLDLICIEPNGNQIWYDNKVSPSGGLLEYDMNASKPYKNDPIENIFWPENGAPKGKYKVYLKYYAAHSSVLPTDYKIKVKYGDKVRNFSGTVRSVGEIIKVCEFEKQ